MTGAMYAAIAGLGAHMNALSVIGNNVANVNTNAYKSSRYVFKEELYTAVRNGSDGTNTKGGVNPGQIGYGCSVGSVDIDMSTKNYDATGRPLDVVIDGDGFLMVGDKGETFDSLAAVKRLNLTRLGNLKFDSDGYLCDSEGNIVYGFLNINTAGADGNNFNRDTDLAVSPVLTAIRVPMVDTLGNPVYPLSGGTEGLPQVVDATTSPYQNPDGGEAPTIALNTQGQPARVVLDSLGINPDGSISGVTKAGDPVVVGYLAIGQVDNPNGVTHVDGHYYKAMGGAGDIHVTSIGGQVQNLPEDGAPEGMLDSPFPIENAGETEINPNGLETSGTNLAKEITNMILMQRGYQANTRIITVTDSMLEELVNMKR